MIQKVKPPSTLKLVHSSKDTKNDLGGQSGESFSRHDPKKEASQDPSKVIPAVTAQDLEPAAVTPDAASIDHQVGLTQVVKDWKVAGKTNGNSINALKLSLKYQGESAPAKGMLLNKKIS